MKRKRERQREKESERGKESNGYREKQRNRDRVWSPHPRRLALRRVTRKLATLRIELLFKSDPLPGEPGAYGQFETGASVQTISRAP